MGVKASKLKSVAWLRSQDGKVLCVRSKGKEKFYISGGKYEAGESDIDALQREIREELGIKLISKSIKQKTIIEAEADGYAFTQLEMKCFTADFEGELSIHSEIEDLAWISFHERDKCAPAAQLAIEYLYKTGALS